MKDKGKKVDISKFSNSIEESKKAGYSDDEIFKAAENAGVGAADYWAAFNLKKGRDEGAQFLVPPTPQDKPVQSQNKKIDFDKSYNTISEAFNSGYSEPEVRKAAAEKGLNLDDFLDPKTGKIAPRESLSLTPREKEVSAHEKSGGGIFPALKRGLLGMEQSAEAGVTYLGNKISESASDAKKSLDRFSALRTFTGGEPLPSSLGAAFPIIEKVGASVGKSAETALKQAGTDKAKIPQHPTMVRGGKEAEKSSKKVERALGLISALNTLTGGQPLPELIKTVGGYAGAAEGFVKEIAESPDRLGFAAELLAEQVPNITASVLTTKGAGGIARGLAPNLAAKKAGQSAVMGSGLGTGSFVSTLGPNVDQALSQGMDTNKAIEYGARRSLMQAAVDMGAGAFIPIKIGGAEIINVPSQIIIQMAGGGGGEYLAAVGMGEDPSKAEIFIEAILEGLGAPIDIVNGYTEARKANRAAGIDPAADLQRGAAEAMAALNGEVFPPGQTLPRQEPAPLRLEDQTEPSVIPMPDETSGPTINAEGYVPPALPAPSQVAEDVIAVTPEGEAAQLPASEQVDIENQRIAETRQAVADQRRAEETGLTPDVVRAQRIRNRKRTELERVSKDMDESIDAMIRGEDFQYHFDKLAEQDRVKEALEITSKPVKQPDSMGDFVRKAGGLKEEATFGGELQYRGITNENTKQAFKRSMVNPETGRNVDDMALAVWEAGYLPEFIERPTGDQFLNALQDDINGNAQLREEDQGYFNELERQEEASQYLGEGKIAPVFERDLDAEFTTQEAQPPVEEAPARITELTQQVAAKSEVTPEVSVSSKTAETAKKAEGRPEKPKSDKKYSVTPKTNKKFSKDKEAIKADILKEAQRINPDVDITFADKLFGEGEPLIRSGAATGERREVAGSYTPVDKLIEVSLNSDKFDPQDTAYHELWHSLEGVLTDVERSTLQKEFPSVGNVSHKEHTAIAFADWAKGKANAKTLPKIKRVFKKIKDFLKSIGQILRGKGFKTAESVFAEAYKGDIGERIDTEAILTSAEKQYKSIDDFQGAILNNVKGYSDQMSSIIEKASKSMPAGTILSSASTAINKAQTFYKDYKNSPDVHNAIDLHWFENAIVHPRNLAKKYPVFTPLWHNAVSMFEMRDTIAATLGTMLETYYSAKGDTKSDVNAVLELGRLNGKEYMADSNGEIVVENTNQGRAQNSKVGDKIKLTAAGVEAYQSARDSMRNALEVFKTMVIEEAGFNPDSINLRSPADIDSYIKENKSQLNKDDLEALEGLKSTIADIESSQRGGYVPFTRFGNTAIIVTDEAGKVVERRHFQLGKLNKVKARVEMKRYTDELNRVYPQSKGYKISDPIPLTSKAALQGVDFNINSLDTLVDAAGLRKEYHSGFRDGLEKELQKRGFKKHFFRSQNIAGYSGNFEKAIGEYVVGMSSYVARRRHAQGFKDALAKIDATKTPKLRKYAERYLDYIQTPQEEWQKMRSMAFAYYLINPSTAALNLTQVPMLTMPYLTMFTDVATITKEFGIAYKDAMKMFRTKGGILGVHLDARDAPADVREDLIAADKDGHLVPQQTFEQMAIAHSMKTRVVKGQETLAKVVDATSKIYSSAERLNRVATYIAAHRIGQKITQKQGFDKKAARMFKDNALWAETSKDGYNPDMFAKWIIDETHYKLGKINRPAWFRGVGAPLLQFKSFSVLTLQLMYDLATKMGPDGKKAFAISMGMLFVSSGLFGLPFMDDLKVAFEAMYKAITDEDLDVEYWLKTEIGEITDGAEIGDVSIAELITKGVSRGTPIDMQSRLSLGKILPVSLLKSMAGGDVKGTDVIRDVGGVSADLYFSKPQRAIEAYKNNRPFYDVIAQLSPKLLENPITAFSWANNGVVSGRSARVAIPAKDLSAIDIAAKVLGFTPSAVAQKREQTWSESRYAKKMSDPRSRFYTRMAKAIIHKTEKISAVWDDINSFNKGRIPAEQVHLDRSYLERVAQGEILGYDAKRAPKRVRSEIARRRAIFSGGRGKPTPLIDALKKAKRTGDYSKYIELTKDTEFKKILEDILPVVDHPSFEMIMRLPVNKRSKAIYEKILKELEK